MHRLTRRNVIATMSGGAVLLCPALLNAQVVEPDWGEVPTDRPLGEDRLIEVPAGPAIVEIGALAAGEVAVIARPTDDQEYSATGGIQYVAVHHRTPEQVATANDRDGTVQDPDYFVVNLVCSHRGKAIGLTGDAAAPFACTDRGDRHSSVYDVSGFGIAGASEDEYLSVPDYTLSLADGVVLELA